MAVSGLSSGTACIKSSCNLIGFPLRNAKRFIHAAVSVNFKKTFYMNKLLLFFACIFIISCNNSEKKTNSKKLENQGLFSVEKVAELKKRCVENGDEKAFRDLVDHYGNAKFENYELLPIAIIMADKHNSDHGRSTIYFSFLDIQNKGREEKQFFNLDKVKQDFILKYLMDGVKNKNPGCLGISHRLIENGLKIEKKLEQNIEAEYKNLR